MTVHIGSIQVNPNDAEPELHFASREFDNTVVHEMEEFLGHELSASEGLVLVYVTCSCKPIIMLMPSNSRVIDRWQLWFRRALHATMPGFPLDILYDIESYDERVQSSASLPVFNRHDQCRKSRMLSREKLTCLALSFVMDHIDIFRKREGSNRNALDLGTCEVRRQPLGVLSSSLLTQAYSHFLQSNNATHSNLDLSSSWHQRPARSTSRCDGRSSK